MKPWAVKSDKLTAEKKYSSSSSASKVCFLGLSSHCCVGVLEWSKALRCKSNQTIPEGSTLMQSMVKDLETHNTEQESEIDELRNSSSLKSKSSESTASVQKTSGKSKNTLMKDLHRTESFIIIASNDGYCLQQTFSCQN
jgi:hypothetical protein